jgi:glycosyltransferase involved in cell wall biosynthesis
MVVTEDWYFLSHRLGLAIAARDAGYDVTIATGIGRRGTEITAAGLRHETFALDRRSTSVTTELGTVAHLVRLMWRARPDLVHLVAAKPLVYGNLAAQLTGRPAIVNAVAGLGYLYLGGGAGRAGMRAIYEGAFRAFVKPNRRARVLIQNPDDAELLVAKGMARRDQLVETIGSGVDTVRFTPVPEPAAPVVVLMHSRMLWDKGVAEVVEAARQLRRRTAIPFVVRLVGDPDPANPASVPEHELRAWNVEGVIEWLGRRGDIPEQLAASHIACLPSYREGAPLSLIEAAAAGRPIVTTDVPGCRTVVHENENGLLVPVRNAEALAGALERLITDASLRKRLGARGRERAVREFSVDVIHQKVLATYAELLRSRR